MDQVLGQILFDTQSRTVLQYHSLLRDLYGYDTGVLFNPTATVPQARETLQGVVTLTAPVVPVVNGPTANGQLYTFTFALTPIPPTPLPTYVDTSGTTQIFWSQLTQLRSFPITTPAA